MRMPITNNPLFYGDCLPVRWSLHILGQPLGSCTWQWLIKRGSGNPAVENNLYMVSCPLLEGIRS